MSDFKWTDKSTVKWFIIYSEGHEGPYSLEYLEQKIKENILTSQNKVWAEGLVREMTLEAVLTLATSLEKKKQSKKIDQELEIPPPLPPLPEEEDVAPEIKIKEQVPRGKWIRPLGVLLSIIIVLSGLLYYGQDQKKKMDFNRPQGMNLNVADRIEKDLEFRGWNEPLFFKEYISSDYSRLWLTSSSFHKCSSVSTHFKSQKDNILSLKDEVVEFEAKGKLSDHLAEFDKFNFIMGKKVIAGMYDMTIQAQGCQWEGVIARLMNFGKDPESNYQAKMTVVLYSKGALEFKDILERLQRKKLEKVLHDERQIEQFWQGVQEQLQTLLAITLQIEQHFLDFISKDARKFHVNVLDMVSDYTQKFGPFLTNFVVDNEEHFKELSKSNLRGISKRKNYESQISESARNLGFTSMKLIEDFQKLKNPRRVQLNTFIDRVKNEFRIIKNELNQKIIQVSDDRSLSPLEDEELQNPSPE